MTRLSARLFPGEGNASRALKVQLPLIEKSFPELKGCHFGTINLEFEAPLILVNPDHRTPPIKWKDSLTVGEVFDLVRVGFEIPSVSLSCDGWLYVAHRSAHRKDTCLDMS